MLRGKNIIQQWRRTAVAIFVAACATTGAAALLLPGAIKPQENQASVSADSDVAGRLDSEFVGSPAVARPAPEPISISLTVDHTRRVSDLLVEAGLDNAAAERWEAYFRSAASITHFDKGHALTILKDPETGDLRGLRYNLDDRVAINELTYGGGVYRSSQELIKYVFRPVAVSFRLRNTFSQDAGRQAVPRSIIETLDTAFRNTNQPLNALPRGSDVKLLYQEKVSRDGTARLTTGVQAASITYGGKTLTAFAFRDENGEPRLYDATGVALEPKALQMPVNFDYISSGFSFHRYHPILHEYRAHEGVDLAAHYGTPVKAVADGRVESAGWCGGLGRCVRIHHDGGIVSIYGHLSRISDGIQEGSSVRVGQIIGQVGSTGLSTGPHLHYAIEKDGAYVNPLSQDLGVNHKVSPRLRSLFDRFKGEYMAALSHLPSSGPQAVTLPVSSAAGSAVITNVLSSHESRHGSAPTGQVKRTAEVMPISGRSSIMR